MPVACLRVPHFALRVALLDRPELDGAPLLLSDPRGSGGRAIVVDATPEAGAKGIRPGMTLREATALCPDALTLLPNPTRESDLQRQLLDRLERFSPAVEPDATETGCWYIDLAGLERHHGAPLPATRRLLQLIPLPSGHGPASHPASSSRGSRPGSPRPVPCA